MTASSAHRPCSACQGADASEPVLDWGLPVNEVIRLYPRTSTVFMEYGVETCCGGSMSVADVTKAYFIPESELCHALRQAMHAPDALSRPRG